MVRRDGHNTKPALGWQFVEAATAVGTRFASVIGMTHRIWLVAHDLTGCGQAAADVALAEMLDLEPGGTILLLHVLTPAPLVTGPEEILPMDAMAVTEAATLDAERALARTADALATRAAGRVSIDMLVEVAASATDTILEVARVHDVERVIVGTHGRRGLTRLLLGSVAEVVARKAEMPVLIVHAPATESDEVTAPHTR